MVFHLSNQDSTGRGKIRCSVLDMLSLRGLVDIQVDIFTEAVVDTCPGIKRKSRLE